MIAIAVLAGAAPGSLSGQEAPQLEEVHPTRSLLLTDVAFLGTRRPALLFGGLYQRSLRPTRTRPDEDGFPERVHPSWYAHVALGGGWSFAREPGGGAVGRIGAGVIRRIDPTAVSALGPVLTATVGERTYGAAARLEVLDNLGLQVGWVHRSREADDRLLLSIDALHCLLADLGIWQGACWGGG